MISFGLCAARYVVVKEGMEFSSACRLPRTLGWTAIRNLSIEVSFIPRLGINQVTCVLSKGSMTWYGNSEESFILWYVSCSIWTFSNNNLLCEVDNRKAWPQYSKNGCLKESGWRGTSSWYWFGRYSHQSTYLDYELNLFIFSFHEKSKGQSSQVSN